MKIAIAVKCAFRDLTISPTTCLKARRFSRATWQTSLLKRMMEVGRQRLRSVMSILRHARLHIAFCNVRVVASDLDHFPKNHT